MRQLDLPPGAKVALDHTELKAISRALYFRIMALKTIDLEKKCPYDQDHIKAELESCTELFYGMGQLYGISRSWMDHMLATPDYTWLWN